MQARPPRALAWGAGALCRRSSRRHAGLRGEVELVRTIEPEKAVVEIIAWPEDKPWTGRYRTSSQIEGPLCTLTLSPEVFHNAAKANTAYRRFAQKIRHEGMEPPNVVFRNMLSRASRNIFCILTTTESVFNSACTIGRMYVVESGIDDRRRLCAVRVFDNAFEEKEAL